MWKFILERKEINPFMVVIYINTRVLLNEEVPMRMSQL